MKRNRIIAVFGSSQPGEGSTHYEEARETGRVLASAGFDVLSGGYGGVMEAVSRGAKEAGGHVIGVVTGFFDARGLRANRFVDEVIAERTYASRMLKLVEMADGYVVLRGGSGTLCELFAAWELVRNGSLPPRPVVLVGGCWKRIFSVMAEELGDEPTFASHARMLAFAEHPGEVAALLQNMPLS